MHDRVHTRSAAKARADAEAIAKAATVKAWVEADARTRQMIATFCERERQREAEDRRRHSDVMPHAQRGLVPGWA
eukprot:11467698-Alexandrium_andersonii.AAC.1